MAAPTFEKFSTSLSGVTVLQRSVHTDSRGSFGKIYNSDVFRGLGLPDHEWPELIYSSSRKDVLRGMHYQKSPFPAAKLISVVQGSILDVVVGVDKALPSDSYGKHFSVEISSRNFKSLYIPAGYAHGFKALEENTIVVYLQSQPYVPSCDVGIRFDSFCFDWNLSSPILSDKDLSLPPFGQHSF